MCSAWFWSASPHPSSTKTKHSLPQGGSEIERTWQDLAEFVQREVILLADPLALSAYRPVLLQEYLAEYW